MTLKLYTYALSLGILLILSVGILSRSGDNNMTGYAISSMDSNNGADNSVQWNGKTTTILLISKDCSMTPAVAYASVGDKVRIEATVYDPSGIAHTIIQQKLEIEIKVRDPEVKVAEFIADKKGSFAFSDDYPCKVLGKKAKTTLIIE